MTKKSLGMSSEKDLIYAYIRMTDPHTKETAIYFSFDRVNLI